jgi:hypothetical protein
MSTQTADRTSKTMNRNNVGMFLALTAVMTVDGFETVELSGIIFVANQSPETKGGASFPLSKCCFMIHDAKCIHLLSKLLGWIVLDEVETSKVAILEVCSLGLFFGKAVLESSTDGSDGRSLKGQYYSDPKYMIE